MPAPLSADFFGWLDTLVEGSCWFCRDTWVEAPKVTGLEPCCGGRDEGRRRYLFSNRKLSTFLPHPLFPRSRNIFFFLSFLHVQSISQLS